MFSLSSNSLIQKRMGEILMVSLTVNKFTLEKIEYHVILVSGLRGIGIPFFKVCTTTL